ncbi:ABC transporter permease [Helicobacter muridarum]|nr:ABC transporter permease [Helicobacter muridarum]STQ87154.1 ABC-2 type transport system permease [Helicobacter muridarum]
MKKFFLTYPFFFIIWAILPILLGAIVYATFFHGIPTNLPIGIIDEDNSATSKELGFIIQSSPSINIKKRYDSLLQAKADIASGDIYGVVVVPSKFQEHTRRGVGSEVVLYYNAEFVLIGKALNAAFLQVIAFFNANIQVGTNLAKDSNLILAKARALPIIPEIEALFNPSNDYSQFLLTVIMPCIWQILVALGMLNLLSNDPKNLAQLIKRLVLNFGLAMIWGYIMLYLFEILGFPQQGSFSIIMLALAVFALGICGIVICLQSVLRDSTRSISVIAAYIAPSLAFAGITYPQNSMESFALFWSEILPISHFMNLYLAQANYALPLSYSLNIIAGMLPFLLFLLLGVCIYERRFQSITMNKIDCSNKSA